LIKKSLGKRRGVFQIPGGGKEEERLGFGQGEELRHRGETLLQNCRYQKAKKRGLKKGRRGETFSARER